MNSAYLLLGSNLDDRHVMIHRAIIKIGDRIGQILQFSSLYESEPWGFSSEDRFLNQVVIVETMLSPARLLSEILGIEEDLGRKRTPGSKGYHSRTIDIDILFYNDLILREEQLNIPHPRIHERMFTLVPLCELNEDFIHPVSGKSMKQLKSECSDRVPVVEYKQ